MPASAAMAGPTLLHVGERSPKDKNFETSEVVMAPPGTVVAPIPKGVEPTEENGIALILAQLLKTAQAKGGTKGGTKSKKLKGMAFGGAIGEGGIIPGVNYTPPVGTPSYSPAPSGASAFNPAASSVGANIVAGLNSVASKLGAGVTNAMSLANPVNSGAGSPTLSFSPSYGITQASDPYSLLNAGNNFAGTLSSYALGQGQLALGQDRLGLDRTIANQNYSLRQQELQSQESIAAGQLGLGQDRLALDRTIAAQQYELGLAQLENALQQVQMQIAAEKFIANQQYQLGLKGLSLQERERLDAWNLGNRQLDIQAADDEFARIMRGVSEASVAGAGGTPTTGIYQ